jgi:hypothetical protein
MQQVSEVKMCRSSSQEPYLARPLTSLGFSVPLHLYHAFGVDQKPVVTASVINQKIDGI